MWNCACDSKILLCKNHLTDTKISVFQRSNDPDKLVFFSVKMYFAKLHIQSHSHKFTFESMQEQFFRIFPLVHLGTVQTHINHADKHQKVHSTLIFIQYSIEKFLTEKENTYRSWISTLSALT